MKHIYWFSYFNSSEPSIRYRALFVLEELARKEGIGHNFVYPSYKLSNILNFLKVYFTVLFFRQPGSLIVFQKIRTNRIYTLALKMLLYFRGKDTLYDIDDANYLHFSGKVIRHFIKNCSACSAGSAALRSYARQYNPNTFLLPSPVINHQHYKHELNEVFTVGWIGYYDSHRENLMELFFPVISKLEAPTKIVLMGVTQEQHKEELRILFKPYGHIQLQIAVVPDWEDEAAIYDQVRQFELRISPLLDTETNRSKSAFKLKQYFSCGVPALASPVGENVRFLQEGGNGYLCKTPEDFKNKLELVMNLSEEEYWELSVNSSNTQSQFSMTQFCDRLLAGMKPSGASGPLPTEVVSHEI